MKRIAILFLALTFAVPVFAHANVGPKIVRGPKARVLREDFANTTFTWQVKVKNYSRKTVLVSIKLKILDKHGYVIIEDYSSEILSRGASYTFTEKKCVGKKYWRQKRKLIAELSWVPIKVRR